MRAYDQQVAQTGSIGNELRMRFVGGINRYDPSAAYKARLRQAQDMFQERFGEGVKNLRSQQTGMGRLNTGLSLIHI